MTSSRLKPITLYDIPCITPGRPWSPNTMKTRYCLGYKRLPFTTVWVEFPDIAGLIQSKGITNPPYTLPAIEDPNAGVFIVDSLAIATYLDETYPDTPKVLSPEAISMIERAEDVFSFGSGGAARNPDVAPRLVFLVLAGERLNPVSKTYYHQTRSARLGALWTTIADACSSGPSGREEHVKKGIDAIRRMWRKMTAIYDRHVDQGGKLAGPFVLGDEPCYLDFAVAGRIKFVLDGLTPSEIESLMISEGNRLMSLVESLDIYYEY